MEFLILGPLEVRSGSGAVHVGSSKQRALLGILLLHANETVSTTRLVDGLWGERPPATAEKLVQGYVHALRKQLGEGILETKAPGYRIVVGADSFDRSEFERLAAAAGTAPLVQSVELRRRALTLWRGPPLADVVLEGPDRHLLARLSELQLSTQLDQIDAELALGRQARLVGELEELAAEHPYQERLAAQLMLALYRSGRQADALDVYRRVRDKLDDELGLQPGQELRDLEAAILRHDERLAAPEQVAEPAGSPPPVSHSEGGEPERGRSTAVRQRRGTVLRVGAGLAVLALALAAAALLLRREPALITIAPNSVAVIDVRTNRVVEGVPVGIRPGPVAEGEGSVWVGNLEDGSLSRIDPATRRVVRNIQLPATPDGIAVGEGAVWVVNGRLGALYRVDPGSDTVTDAIPLGDGRAINYAAGSVDVGAGSVWAAFGDDTLARADPDPDNPRADGLGTAGSGPAAVVVAFDSVWVCNSGDATVQRFDPVTFEEGPLRESTIGKMPSGIAAGAGAVWIASTGDDVVTKLEVDSLGFSRSSDIPVGDGPTGIAVGSGAVWVANSRAGTVSRINPATDEVEATIPVGDAITGIAAAGDSVWVTVQAP